MKKTKVAAEFTAGEQSTKAETVRYSSYNKKTESQKHYIGIFCTNKADLRRQNLQRRSWIRNDEENREIDTEIRNTHEETHLCIRNGFEEKKLQRKIYYDKNGA